MVWRPEDPQGDEAGKIRHMIVPYTRGIGLDLGCGPFKAWPHMIGVDNFDEYGGFEWRPDIVTDCCNLSMFADRSLPYVFSSHLLEHLEDTEKVLREWWRVIQPGGHLILYLPHADLYPRMGEPGSNPDHHHDFHPDDIVKMMMNVGHWDLVENQTRNQGREYSFLQVYRKGKNKGRAHRMSHVRRYVEREGKLRCLVIRYGGFGDLLMASSVLPALKAQNYHITFNCTPKGQDVLRHDPHIDEWWIQDRDQVPNDERLMDYWKALAAEGFDKVVNLSESIEGPLLALPNRRLHALSDKARRLLCNVNYLEFTHAIAGVPGPPRSTFYTAKDERRQAQTFRKRVNASPTILWALAGSSVHKMYPWVAEVVIWLLEKLPHAKFVFVGGREEQIIEHAIAQQVARHLLGLEHEETDKLKLSGTLAKLKEHWGENRLICKSGAWSIRESMSFAQHADIIVGPETGIMHAAAFNHDVLKIVMLSHSNVNNLTRDWQNTISVEPTHVACYPCHRMHYNRDFCPEHEETGAAMCAGTIPPGHLVGLVTHYWEDTYGQAAVAEDAEGEQQEADHRG